MQKILANKRRSANAVETIIDQNDSLGQSMQSLSIDGTSTRIEVALKEQQLPQPNRQQTQQLDQFDDGFSDLNSRADNEFGNRKQSAVNKAYAGFGVKQSVPISESDFDRESEQTVSDVQSKRS